MSIITLTTDLGLKDYYVGAIKGAILSQCKDVVIVDISHDVAKYNIVQAGFVLKNVYNDFPPDTIHIIGVMSFSTVDISHVAVYYNNHYFIGADNGMFSILFNKIPDKIVELNISQEIEQLTFPTKNIFVKAACHIARGGTLEVIGKEKKMLSDRTIFQPVVTNNRIRATVIYIDSFGNVITNITKTLFKEIGKTRDFTISFRMPGYNITSISQSYQDVIEGERLALFGSNELLEIAINVGNASELLGINQNDIIIIEFHDN